jgi:type II secretory pathway pseudopilin PulG
VSVGTSTGTGAIQGFMAQRAQNKMQREAAQRARDAEQQALLEEVAAGIAEKGLAEGQREPTATDGTGQPRVSGRREVAASETFDNWDDMKDAHRGTVTRFMKDNKPLGSPVCREPGSKRAGRCE